MKPRVSFVLLTYNQEKWVREAVQSALVQDYPNLEILIYDDCSTDTTFSVIESVINAGDSNKHVVCYRNSQNLSIGKNVSQALAKARGDLVVMAAGDDISAPNRVSVMVDQWERFGRPPAVGSSLTVIDENGLPIPAHRRQKRFSFHRDSLLYGSKAIRDHFARHGGIAVLGATLAYSATVLDTFGRDLDDVLGEDLLLLGRALILGGCLKIAEPLVFHRVTGCNVSVKKRDSSQLPLKAARSVEPSPVLEYADQLRNDRRRLQRLTMFRKQVEDVTLAHKAGLLNEGLAARLMKHLKIQRAVFERSDKIVRGSLLQSITACISEFGFVLGVRVCVKQRLRSFLPGLGTVRRLFIKALWFAN